MRSAAALVLALFAAPALTPAGFAQEAPKFAAPAQSPPPEGFYKDIPNAYDLLMRPSALPNPNLATYVCRIERTSEMTDKDYWARVADCKETMKRRTERSAPRPKQ